MVIISDVDTTGGPDSQQAVKEPPRLGWMLTKRKSSLAIIEQVFSKSISVWSKVLHIILRYMDEDRPYTFGLLLN